MDDDDDDDETNETMHPENCRNKKLIQNLNKKRSTVNDVFFIENSPMSSTCCWCIWSGG